MFGSLSQHDRKWVECVRAWPDGRLFWVGNGCFVLVLIPYLMLIWMLDWWVNFDAFFSEVEGFWRMAYLTYWGVGGPVMMLFGAPIGALHCESMRRISSWYWEWFECAKPKHVDERLKSYKYGHMFTIWWTRVMGAVFTTFAILMILRGS